MSKAKIAEFLAILVYSLILLTTASPTSTVIQQTLEKNKDIWKQSLPDAIIIGAKKCGTRALLKFIGTHPNVSTAGAEVHFFDRFYHMGLDWYR